MEFIFELKFLMWSTKNKLILFILPVLYLSFDFTIMIPWTIFIEEKNTHTELLI